MRLWFFCVLVLAICGCALGQPQFPTTYYSGAAPSLVTDHWSETANYAQYRPTWSDSTQQINCPFSDPNVVGWGITSAWEEGAIPSNGLNATVAANTTVLLSSGDITDGTVFGYISIPAGSALVFNDQNLTLETKGIEVRGSLKAGSPTCRLKNRITITLWGERNAQPLPSSPYVKGIAVYGSIDIHGNQYFPTWTRLASTADANATVIFLQDVVNWQPGQQIIVTTTQLKDSRDFTQTEVRTIQSVELLHNYATVSVITLTAPLEFLHYAGLEYQAEVALLSRDILVQGDPDNSEPTDNVTTCYDFDDPLVFPRTNSTHPCADQFLTGFGGHIQVIGPESEGRFSGVELYRMGQTNVLARYPLHFHMMFEKNESTASISDCSVHRSFYRCFVIHGTNNTLVTQNTAYDAIGNCFYLSENGVEERSTISYNFAAFVHPLGNPALPSYQFTGNQSWQDGDGWYAQYLDFFEENEDLLIPADLSAACFYITNGYNNIYGNAAAGGWTGFSFPALINPISDFKNLTNFSPSGRPFLSPFRGNTAHSSGFWWASAGAFYFGGQLDYADDAKTTLRYTAGRSDSHDTCSDPTITTGCYGSLQLWLELEDNKAFLSHRGLQAWGNRADIVRFEMHDVSLSMNVFGQVWIDNLLLECRSANTPNWFANCAAAQGDDAPDWNICNVRDWYFFSSIHGFQWYDVGQDHILTNSIFRNCRSDWFGCVYGPAPHTCDSSVFQSLTHSDQFVPENMQITKNITFENCNNLRSYTTDSTGNPLNQTVSGRLQNWVDWDGTISGFGVKSQIGSNRSYHWWDYNGSCPVEYEAYMCAQGDGDGQASIVFGWNYTYQQEIGGEYCSNGNADISCPVVGEVIHFGREKGTGLVLGLNSKLTGPVIYEAGGWFINLTSGTPKQVNFTGITIDPNFNLVLALPYPAGTTFNITYEAADWCSTDWATCSFPFEETASVQSVYEGIGNLYHFADSILYIRITMQASSWDQDSEFTFFTEPANFSRDGLTLFLASQSYVSILADCTTDPCQTQDVAVPAAINPSTSTATTSTGTTLGGGTSTGSDSSTTKHQSGVTKSTFTTLRTSGTTSTSKDSSSGCFAASSSVRVSTGQDQVTSKLLSELAVGDLVESFDGKDLVFSPVYFVAHAGDEKKFEVIILEVEEYATTLKLTPHHLLLAASNLLSTPELKPASDVNIGEFLFIVSDSNVLTPAKVTSSQRSSDAVRNPLTLNNKIVVSGFACSAFAYSATFYSIITRPAQMLYELMPSAFEPNTLLSSLIDALVVITDWVESKKFASVFIASADSL